MVFCNGDIGTVLCDPRGQPRRTRTRTQLALTEGSSARTVGAGNGSSLWAEPGRPSTARMGVPSEARPPTGPSRPSCGEAAPRRRSHGCHPRDAVSNAVRNAVRNATRNTIRDPSVTMGATPFRAQGDLGPNRDSLRSIRGGRVDGAQVPTLISRSRA